MRFLNNCIEEYKSYFPVDWIGNICDWDDESESDIEQNYTSGLQRIDDYIKKCFELVSKSVISGEYIVNEKNIKLGLDEWEHLVENEYSPTVANSFQLDLYKKYQKLDDNLYIIINLYKRLIHVVENKVSQEQHYFIVNAFSTYGRALDIPTLKMLERYIFDLYIIDHCLSYNKRELPNLILLLEHLSEEERSQDVSMRPIFTILKEKCAFLIKKLVYLDGQIEYSINFKNKLLDKHEITTDIFKDFSAYFDFFYKDDYRKDERCVFEWQKLCYDNKASIGQMVLLIKYYKDSDTAHIQQVNKLISEFNRKYKRVYRKYIDREFDIYALNTTKNYMYNCRLSFLMKHNYSFDALLQDMIEIEEIQEETHIKNFYPYRKAVEFIINDIQNDIRNENTIEETILNNKVAKLESYIGKLEDSIRWCKEQNFYPVQLFYNECITYNQDFHLRIFVPSSFSRPINYNQLLEHFNQYKIKAEMLKSEISIQKERLEVEKLKEKIKESERGNIKNLGAFTAIITFLFGCVNIFSNGSDGKITVYEHILHIVCLGLILLFFISCIYFLTLEKERKTIKYFSHLKFWFFGVSAILYAGLLAFILYHNILARDYVFY